MVKQLLKLLKEKTSSTFGGFFLSLARMMMVFDHGKVVKEFFTNHFVGTHPNLYKLYGYGVCKGKPIPNIAL